MNIEYFVCPYCHLVFDMPAIVYSHDERHNAYGCPACGSTSFFAQYEENVHSAYHITVPEKMEIDLPF